MDLIIIGKAVNKREIPVALYLRWYYQTPFSWTILATTCENIHPNNKDNFVNN